jgi:DNA polymerase I-like protein with 3'-5' exonuclease and polymerase domains
LFLPQEASFKDQDLNKAKMRVLVNYSKADKPHLSSLAYILRQHGITALSTAKDLTIGELLSQAKTTSCDAILLCNEQTLRYCVPGDAPTLDKWRGSRLNFSTPTIVINKLEHIRTVPHGQWLLEQDVGKLKYIHTPLKSFGYTLLDDPRKFPIALAELSRSIATAYDVETKTFDAVIPKDAKEDDSIEAGQTIITCASWCGIYADGSLRTYVLPLVDFGVDHWVRDEDYAAALLLLKRINGLPIPKIMHNGMYDCTHSIRYHAPPVNYRYDTMSMAHAQYAELPKTLDFVASYELYDYIFWKDDAENAAKSKNIEQYWTYNAKDTFNTARVAIQQLRNAPAYARRNFASKFRTIFPALYCNFEGVRIDQPKRKELRAEASTKLNQSRGALRVKFADANFNPGSWQQVEKYIYRVFGAKRPGLGKSKSCTDEMNLKAVAQQHPLLARLTTDILNYREAQKAIGTYYDFLQLNGRLLYALNPFGTETERMACSASSFWCGTQVQNVPGYAKEMLVADPGFELFEADNKQSEGRTTAYCSQETTLIAALEDAERDFYKVLGELFFKIPYDKVTKEFRNKVIKRIVHGSNYMMGPDTFISNVIKEVEEGLFVLYKAAGELGITITPSPRKNREKEMNLKSFVKFLLDSYHGPFPRIRKWYKELQSEIAATGFLVSPLGHHRRFFGDINTNHNMLRGAVAHQPQNLSVTILDRGYNRIYNELVIPYGSDIRIKAQIHDSVFGQIRLGTREYFGPKILACMDNPVVVHGRTLRIPVDIKFGNNWAEGSKANPNGTFDWKG